MIVISQSLVLSPPPVEFGLNNPVIGWRNIVTPDTISSDTAEAGYPVTNLANPSTAALWKGAEIAEELVTVLVSETGPIDYVAIARHNFGSAGIAVTVEGRVDEEDDFAVLVEETLLPDDAPALFRFPAQSLYEVRLKLAIGTVPPQGAVLFAGRLLVFPRRIYVGHTPLPMGRRTDVVNGRSESGNFLGRVVTGGSLETAASFQNLPPDWYREHFEPFARAAMERPFFWAWRPEKYPREIGYSWLTGDPQPQNQRPNGMMQVELKLAGVAL